MAERNEPLSKGSERAGPLPPLGEYVWVQCQRYTTIAYRDAKGVWRSLGRGKKLSRITRIKWPRWPVPAC